MPHQFNRSLLSLLTEELQHFPAVALLGPRQVGKTTLALNAAQSIPSMYLDLESERDRAKLMQPELYLVDHLDKLITLDEVHRAPGLFPVLRGLIDQARRTGTSAQAYRSSSKKCWGVAIWVYSEAGVGLGVASQ